ncbi:MAG: ferrous iron transport protein A [Spirochaetia bacterium]
MNSVKANEKQAVPLSQEKSATKVCVHSIHGGQGLQAKLISMGIVPGRYIDILHTSQTGPIVINVLNSKVMIGQGMAERILVTSDH